MKALSGLLVLVSALWLQTAFAQAPALKLGKAAGSYPLAQCFEVLEDARGAYRVNDLGHPAVSQRFQPAATEGKINFGYSTSVYWLRCRLASDRPAAWLLEIAYPSLDNVQVYTGADGEYRMQEAGDRQPFSVRPYPHRNIVFLLQLPSGAATLYLRVQSEGNLTVPATLWQPEAFHRQDNGTYALLGAYYGVLAALGLYNLLLFFSLKDRRYLEYVLFVSGMAIGQASLNGFGNQFLWPQWPAWGNVALPVGFALAALFAALFTRSFLDLATTAPRLNRLNWGFAIWFALAIPAPVWSYRGGAMLVSLGGLGYSLFACWAGLQCFKRGHHGARYFLLAWTLLLIGVGAMGARNFGWLPTNFFTMYSMQIGSTLEMVLLSFALADRFNAMRREREQMVEALQRAERELDARIKARTRELEAVNAQLRENEQALAKVARQDPLTGLGNRMMLENELDAAVERARRAGSGVAVLLIDLDGFKPVNDTYGHALGDVVLKEVAERLKASVRKSDSVVRIGGDEFVVVVEGLQVLDDAAVITEKLLCLLAQPFLQSGISLSIGASIGMSRFPEDGDTLRDLLHKADMFMYAAKAAGGNVYRHSEQLSP